MRTRLILAAALVLVVCAVVSAAFTVDRTEFVYVTRFGRPVATYDGETDAGLYFKWPWPVEAVQRLDHRLQVFDLPTAELLTHDPRGKTIDKTVTVDAYVLWRIADRDSVDQFIRTVGTPERVRDILRQPINSRLGAEIGTMSLDDLVSVAPAQAVEARMDRLRARLLGEADGLTRHARTAYGVEIVDVRLRRFNYPPQVRDAIFARIRSEREKKAADYRSEGDQLAADIRSKADADAALIRTEARAKEQRLKGQADADADRIRNVAHGKDPSFYAFLKKLKEYEQILGDNKSVLLLSAHRDLFDLLFKPPDPLTLPSPPTAGGEGRVRGGTTPRPVATPGAPKPPTTGGGP